MTIASPGSHCIRVPGLTKSQYALRVPTNLTMGVNLQAYVPYNTPYPLPISTSKQPKYVGQVSTISFPDVNTSALFALAGGAKTNFGLRFTGA